MPSPFAIASKQNYPKATCHSCLGPMAYHKSGLCTHCGTLILTKEPICPPTSSNTTAGK